MRCCNVLMVFLFVFWGLFAQKGDMKRIDSLKNKLNELSEVEQIPIFLGLSRAYFKGQGTVRDSVYFFADQALKLSRKYNQPSKEADALMEFGYLYGNKRKIDKALDYAQQAIDIGLAIADTTTIFTAYGVKGYVYFAAEKYDNAAHCFEISSELIKKTQPEDSNNLFYNLVSSAAANLEAGKLDRALNILKVNNVLAQDTLVDIYYRSYYYEMFGNIKLKQRKFEEAKPYFEQALILGRKMKDPSSIYYSLIKLSVVHNNLGHYKSALPYLNEALPIAIALGDKLLIAETYFEKGNAQINSGDCKNAIANYTEAALNYEAINEPVFKGKALKQIGLIKKQNIKETSYLLDLNKAKLFAKNGIKKAQQENNANDLMEGYLLLSQVDSILGNHLESLQMYQKHIAIKDSIYNLNNKVAIEDLEVAQKTSKKEQKIAYLKSQNKLAKLQNEKQKKYFIAQLLILGLVLTLLLLFFNRYRIKKRHSRSLKRKKMRIQNWYKKYSTG